MTRCDNCRATYYDYSEGYQSCLLGLYEDECRYTKKTIERELDKMNKAEAEECGKMVEFFEKQEKENKNET